MHNFTDIQRRRLLFSKLNSNPKKEISLVHSRVISNGRSTGDNSTEYDFNLWQLRSKSHKLNTICVNSSISSSRDFFVTFFDYPFCSIKTVFQHPFRPLCSRSLQANPFSLCLALHLTVSFYWAIQTNFFLNKLLE